MSEEEIIKECEEIIKDLNNHKDKDFIGRLYYKNRPVEDLLNDILNLYNKEKEKNGILQEELERKIEALDKTMNNPDYISKDKIKDKIGELKKEADYRTIDNPTGRIHFHKEPCDYQIEVLQELLEERN